MAIADVSHYVKPGEPIDDDAYERATSVYFPRRVIPMLPEKLSNGLCSLNPEQDRLSMVCDMVVDGAGAITAYQFYPAVICSQARFTYTEVAAILGNTRGPEAQRRSELVPHLIHLHEVYRALLKHRGTRGAVDFETTETQIVADENGRIERIEPRKRNEAHRLIEEAMLAANVCAAEFIADHGHPALYRVHEGPTTEKRITLQNYLKAMGLGVSLSDDPTPGELQAIALATRERPDATQIHAMLLRSMQQAHYTAANSGHFGLAYEAYTHFTSPIRRYPDLLVHRVIKALLNGKRYHLATGALEDAPKAAKATRQAQASRAGTGAVERRGRALQQQRAACRRSLARRRGVAEVPLHARAAGRRVQRHGQRRGAVRPLRARSTTCTSRAWCTSPRSAAATTASTRCGRSCTASAAACATRAGTRVRVQVSRVDLDSRRIDFRMVREGEGERLLSRGRKLDARSPQAELAAVRARDRAAKKGLARAAKARPRPSGKKNAKSTRARSPRG